MTRRALYGLSTIRALRTLTQVPSVGHLQKLQHMYASAPISGLFNKHQLSYSIDGDTTIEFTCRKEHCHTAGTLHGSGYFKLLDDAAFFAAQARVEDGFAYTTSFTTFMMRPVDPESTLVARGRVTSTSKALVVAESTLEEAESGKLVAQGLGTFQRGAVPLSALKEYREG